MKKAGRPRIDIEKYFTKIQPYLQLGYSLHKACLYAETPYTSLKPYYDEDENFRNRVERERNYPNVRARRALLNAIEKDDAKVAIEWLQSMEKDDFSKRTEVEAITPTSVTINYIKPETLPGPSIDATQPPVRADEETR